MIAIPLRKLLAGLANTPTVNDQGAICDYRKLCAKVYFTGLQVASSGAYPANVLDGFPSIPHSARKNAGTLAEVFERKGCRSLIVWARHFSDWFAALPEDVRERMGATEVTP